MPCTESWSVSSGLSGLLHLPRCDYSHALWWLLFVCLFQNIQLFWSLRTFCLLRWEALPRETSHTENCTEETIHVTGHYVGCVRNHILPSSKWIWGFTLLLHLISQPFNEAGNYLHYPDEKTSFNPLVVPIMIVTRYQRQKRTLRIKNYYPHFLRRKSEK